MVNFGVDNSIKCKNFFILTDDINESNFEKYNTIYNKSTLMIDYKFPMPLNSNIVVFNRSKTVSLLDGLLDNLEKQVKNKQSKLFSTETQFRNFKTKVLFWITDIFSDVVHKLDDNDTEDLIVVIRNTVSKHEFEMAKLLNKLGVSVLVISNNAETLDITDIDNIETDISGTKQDLSFKSSNDVVKVIVSSMKNTVVSNNTYNKEYNNTEDIEAALYDTKDVVKVIVSGMKNYIDTCNFYGRLYKECQNNSDWVLVNEGFSKPTYEQTSVFPRLKIDKHDYIIETITKFVNIKDAELKNSIQELIKTEFYSSDYHSLNGQILYNKLVYSICVLNELFKNNKPSCIVYYGNINTKDLPVLSIIAKLNDISLIVTCSDKSKVCYINGISTLELESSTEVFEMPIVDKRENASTLAAQAEHRANTTLFNGDTLGFYKPGQFRTAKIKHFNTTFDEIKLWWNRELYMRPGFESLGDTAVIPSITKLIKGVKDSEQKYLELIQMFSCGKTILCKNLADFSNMKSSGNRMHILRCVDINGTKFEDQKLLYENSKLNKDRIKSDKNYSYGFMDLHKQNFILDNIELILNYDYIKTNGINKQEYTDLVLNTLLNLDKTLLQYIQWFEYYTYNPNLILIINEETQMSLENMIMLTFMSNIGFDILIFVPTGYTTIENLKGPLFMYDEHIVGEYAYNINTNNISVTSNIEIEEPKEEKKQGFFSKLFN